MPPFTYLWGVALPPVAVGVGGLEVVESVETALVMTTGNGFATLAYIEEGKHLGNDVLDVSALEFHLAATKPAAAAVSVKYVAKHLATVLGVPASGGVGFVQFQVPALNLVHRRHNFCHRPKDLPPLSVRDPIGGSLSGPLRRRGQTALTVVLWLVGRRIEYRSAALRELWTSPELLSLVRSPACCPGDHTYTAPRTVWGSPGRKGRCNVCHTFLPTLLAPAVPSSLAAVDGGFGAPLLAEDTQRIQDLFGHIE